MRESGLAAGFTADVGQRFDLLAGFRQVDLILFAFFEIQIIPQLPSKLVHK